MKTITIAQPNFQQGPKKFNAHYLPYSGGILWAYCQQFSEITDNYKFNRMIWEREDVESLAQDLSQNDIVGFSTYVWNRNYNYGLAKRIRELNPDVYLFFGGPEIPVEDKKIFEKYPFMDLVVCLEGEITLKNVLIALHKNEDLKAISGLLINDNGKPYRTESTPRIQDLGEVPSPYLLGLFDDLIKDHGDYVEWNATLETNRGCPYQCTFCDWGSLTYSKVKKFELERVFDEIEWTGRNKCGFITIADANFGMFIERDHMIADKILETQEKYGYPKGVSLTWAKNQKAEVLEIVKKMFKLGTQNMGLTVSVQSMDAGVLDTIKRTNLNQHKINEIFSLCDKSNIPVDTELILGMPNETLSSWKKSVFDVIRAGNHNGITIHQTQLLENAEMNLFQRRAYKMETSRIYDYMSGSYNVGEYQESVEVVMATSTMSREQMIDAQVFNWFINTFHISGLTTWIARFLNKKLTVEYDDFYEKLYRFISDDPWFAEEEKKIRSYYEQWAQDGKINHPDIGNVAIHGWNLIHRTVINIHIQRKHLAVFDLFKDFLEKNYNLESAIMDQLLQFQEKYIIGWEMLSGYPNKKTFDYDFLGYLQDNKPLDHKTAIEFDFRENKDMSLDEFCENIYFGRKRLFGRAKMRVIHDI